MQATEGTAAAGRPRETSAGRPQATQAGGQPRWRKSRASNPSGSCVEVAQLPGGVIAVRDSRDPSGSALAYPGAQVTAFLAAVKNGDFDDMRPGGAGRCGDPQLPTAHRNG